jgi:hypothetical protein
MSLTLTIDLGPDDDDATDVVFALQQLAAKLDVSYLSPQSRGVRWRMDNATGARIGTWTVTGSTDAEDQASAEREAFLDRESDYSAEA